MRDSEGLRDYSQCFTKWTTSGEIIWRNGVNKLFLNFRSMSLCHQIPFVNMSCISWEKAYWPFSVPILILEQKMVIYVQVGWMDCVWVHWPVVTCECYSLLSLVAHRITWFVNNESMITPRIFSRIVEIKLLLCYVWIYLQRRQTNEENKHENIIVMLLHATSWTFRGRHEASAGGRNLYFQFFCKCFSSFASETIFTSNLNWGKQCLNIKRRKLM